VAFALPSIEEELGKPAPEFSLPGTDGRTYSLADVSGPNGTVVVFICNHCPYVQASIARLVEDANLLAKDGVKFVAIASNDVEAFPEDSFVNMKTFAEKHALPFPYLFDESQNVARAYGALCTPDYFGIDKDGSIEYRGRLDEGKKDPPPPGAKRELLAAMQLIAKKGQRPGEQIPSVGCSIKWKDE
jgi:peroxiredoxin